MIAILLALLQADHGDGGDHGSSGGGHEEPFVVEQLSHLLGGKVPGHLILTVLLFLVVIVLVLVLRGKLSVDKPSRGQQLLEMVVEQLRTMLDQVVGPYGRRYMPVVGSFAMFILFGNLMGLIPGLGAPTDNINVTGALGITSFLYYMFMGFRQQGISYLKHFTGGLTSGPLVIIGVLIFFVELLSNSVRPVTLALRLFVNMFADHQIAKSFLDLAPPLVPIFTIVLGVFVSFVQTFIFIMLSMVYLSETVPHEEHDHDDHGHTEAAAAH
jgi:F-type H+-transporting ATPase subunit a